MKTKNKSYFIKNSIPCDIKTDIADNYSTRSKPMAKEIYSFYYLPTGKAQYAALREIKKFVTVKLRKIKKHAADQRLEIIENHAYRIIDLLKPTFSRKGSIVRFSNVDEYTPINDVRVLRKIYNKCLVD